MTTINWTGNQTIGEASTAPSIVVTGTAGNGFIEIPAITPNQSPASSSVSSLFSDSSGIVKKVDSSGNILPLFSEDSRIAGNIVIRNLKSSTALDSNAWQSVCWSPSLSIFVAVSSSGTFRVGTSPDGINWSTHHASNENASWNSIAWSPSLSRFVAVSSSQSSGTIMYSSDGINWTTTSPQLNTNNDWNSVCWSPDLNIFVAVGDSSSGTNRQPAVITSTDGINWIFRDSANESLVWKSVVWASALSLFVAVAYSGTGNKVMTSPDGITWTSHSSSNDLNNWDAICWAPELNKLVMGAYSGTNRIAYSQDAISWTGFSSSSNSTSISWSPQLNLFISTSASGYLLTSPDAITWTLRAQTPANNWTSSAWAPNLNRLVIMASSGTGRVLYSI